MTNLATITDIQAVRPIGQISSSLRVDMYITEAQTFDVAPSIGLTLMAWLIANPTDAKAILLVSGGEYTVNSKVYECLGLKKAIAYYSYCRIVKNNCINVTAFGVTEKTTDNSEPAGEAKVSMAVREAEASGNACLESCIRLLINKPTDYPLADVTGPRGCRFKVYGD